MINGKTIVNLFAGPGAGKSTTAALIYAKAKQLGINSEMSREYVKNWVWERRKISYGDQVYITSAQSRQELVLCRANVDLIIVDSPVLLGAVYERESASDLPQVVPTIYEHHKTAVKRFGYDVKNFLIRRDKPYKIEGRLHTESQARVVDEILKDVLSEYDVDYVEVSSDEIVDNIFSY